MGKFGEVDYILGGVTRDEQKKTEGELDKIKIGH